MDSTTPPPQNPVNPVSNPASSGVPQAGTPVATGTATSGVATTAVNDKSYNVPQVVLDKYPALVELIKKTESMTDEEREYWFQILPIMTEEQVNRLKGILEEEATQLAKLDDQYQDQLSKLNQKHLDEWSDFQRKKERVAVQEAEAQTEAQETAKEEDILKQLEDPSAGTPGTPGGVA